MFSVFVLNFFQRCFLISILFGYFFNLATFWSHFCLQSWNQESVITYEPLLAFYSNLPLSIPSRLDNFNRKLFSFVLGFLKNWLMRQFYRALLWQNLSSFVSKGRQVGVTSGAQDETRVVNACNLRWVPDETQKGCFELKASKLEMRHEGWQVEASTT